MSTTDPAVHPANYDASTLRGIALYARDRRREALARAAVSLSRNESQDFDIAKASAYTDVLNLLCAAPANSKALSTPNPVQADQILADDLHDVRSGLQVALSMRACDNPEKIIETAITRLAEIIYTLVPPTATHTVEADQK